MNAAEPELTTQKVGTVIDRRYRITGLLGRGGMGSVYKAEHVRIRRPVAIKLLHPGYGQVEEIAKRFEREAFATGRITHPNIVSINDFGELEDGTLYLVMELLDGISLGDLMADGGRMKPARALAIIKHVLRGLGHAHASQIIHRDVKPENILLVEHAGDPEFAKVLDFGIAKLVGEAEDEEGGQKLTQAGVAFGTPTYISPEQATGSSVDHRADIYCSSVMLYEMLCGRPPFVSDDKLKLLAQHATRKAPSFAEAAPDAGLSPELEALVQRGLEKQAKDRWPDTASFIEAIQIYESKLAAQAFATSAADALPLQETSDAGLVVPGLAGTGGTRATTAFAPGAMSERRKRQLVIGLVVGGVMLLVIILANAARSSGDSSALKREIAVLETAKTCADRKKAVSRLSEIGDAAAIKALEKARKRRDNKCLTDAAKKAVKQLRAKR